MESLSNMPTNNLASVLQSENANPSDDVILYSLELIHPSIRDENDNPASIRIVRDYGTIIDYQENGQPIFGHELGLEASAPLNAGQVVKFIACQFDFTFPKKEENRISSVDISIDNVSSLVSKHLDDAVLEREDMEIILRLHLSSIPNIPQQEITGFKVSDVKSDDFKVTITANYDDLISVAFPKRTYTEQEFISLA